MLPFFFSHGEVPGEIGVTGGDFGIDGLGVFVGEVFGGDMMGSGVGDDFAGEVVAHAEGDAVIFHEFVGDFLGAGPVQVQFFQGAGGVDDQVVQDFVHGGENFGGLRHDVSGAV